MPKIDLPNGYYDLPPGKLANLVTCLEMRAQPARALVPFPEGLRLERVRADELARYRAVFRAVGSDLMWFSRLIMPDQDLAGLLSEPEVHSYFLCRAGEAIGLLELNFREMPDCELAFFGLVPQAVGAGLGRALMDEAIRQAFARSIARFWVHTCSFDSPQAVPFYMRSGFLPYARMIEIHDDPRLQGKLNAAASAHVPVIRGDGA